MIEKKNISFYLKKLSERIDIDEYSKKLQNKALHFTIYDNNKLIGFSPCYFNDTVKGVGYISSLTIRSSYRTFGLGSYLLDEIKKYAKNNDFYTVMVSIHIDNKVSSDFYRKNSFKVFEQNREKSIVILKYYKE